MLAGRFELKIGNKVIGETPMLVPAFSSKFEPAIGSIIKQMPEYINGPILISAYDVYYKDITKIKVPITFCSLLFLDSGGYEVSQDRDLADIVHDNYKPKEWNKEKYLSVLDNWSYKRPTVIVSYDHPQNKYSTGRQIKIAKSWFKDRKNVLSEILIKPEPRNKMVSIDHIIENVELLNYFDIVGFTEKELGRSIIERMENITRTRIAMREKDVSRPIHIFGSLDMLSTPLYFIAGADIFDGLTWLRYGYVNGLSIYEQNFGLITALPLDSTDVYTRGRRVVFNLDELAKLRQKMANYLVDGDLKKLEQFKSHAGLFRNAFDALRSRLKSRGKEVI